jgi:hypothetical protein
MELKEEILDLLGWVTESISKFLRHLLKVIITPQFCHAAV